MNNKKAIKVLQEIKEHPSMSVELSEEYEALDIAIKALENRQQSDLISRSALKEVLKENEWITDDPFAEGGGLEDIIDNAPSVEQEVYIHGEDYNFFIRGYKEGRKDFERPRGEWIQATDEEGIEIYRKILCSRCNEASVEKYSFCPNCGAQMKGGAVMRGKEE